MTILPLMAGALALALLLRALAGPTVALLALAFAGASASPALAQTAAVAAPWVTSILDQGAAWLIGLALSALGGVSVAMFKVALPAVLEARIRQTALTGAHVVILRLEAEAASAWTPDRRRVAVNHVVNWVMDRMPGSVARLRLSRDVVSGIALKMLNQALSGQGASASSLPGSSMLTLLPGAALDAAGADLGAVTHSVPVVKACPTCGATDPERMARGCTAENCPQVPVDPAAGLAAAAGAAMAVPAMLLGNGLVPTGA